MSASQSGTAVEPKSRVHRRVSIVIPTFNRAAFLRESVDSCLNQTHTDIELIVVDDGSTDNTGELLSGWNDPRLVRLRHERNLGLPEALNTGFRHSTGAYLSWACDDDRYTPNAIAEMVAFLEQTRDVDFTYADYWFIDADGNIVREVDVGPSSRLRDENCVGPCRLYRRHVYEVVGDYDPETRLAEDYDYWLRVAQHFRMVPTQGRLYYFRQHSGSLTGRFGFDAARVGERVRLRHGCVSHAAHRRAMELVDMQQALATGRRVETWRTALAAIARDPRHLANRAVLALLFDASVGTALHARIRALLRSHPPRRAAAEPARASARECGRGRRE